jgi:hypothetical protein
MNALTLSSLILAAEFALTAWAILFFLMRQHNHQVNNDLEHADAVIKKLEHIELSRRDALTVLFESTYQLEAEELKAKVDEYVLREQAFYQAMLSLYLERDGKKLGEIPAELAKVIDPWTDLATGTPANGTESEEDKAKLAEELETTRHTLDELMKEYSAAFNVDSDNKDKDAPKKPAEPVKKLAEPTISPEELEGLVDLFDAPGSNAKS